MTDIERAKTLLADNDYTCVLCKGNVTHTSNVNGIYPLIKFLSEDTDLKGFSAADKIVGKGAAMLFALAGVKEVFSNVMSEPAIGVFSANNILYSYNTVTKHINNRAGTGLCPIENTVMEIDNPQTAFDVLKQKFFNKD